MQDDQLSISPSGFNPALSAVVPRLLPGELIARHVATMQPLESTNCSWCNQPFKEGEDFVVDVYQQDGQSETVLHVKGKQVPFCKTALLMMHAKDCLPKMSVKATEDLTEQVTLSQRKNRVLHAEDIKETVWKQFRWAVRWVSWHHQYLIGDPIQLTLGSKRPLLTAMQCKSFLLEMTKSHKYGATIHSVLVPMLLVDAAFIEALFTRVYEYDLIYKGKFQPIIQLKQVFDKAPFNTTPDAMNVAAFVHTTLPTSYSSRHADEQYLKVLVKVKPSVQQLEKLVAHYRSLDDAVTWVMLHRHICMTRSMQLNQKKKKTTAAASASASTMVDDPPSEDEEENEEINPTSFKLIKALYDAAEMCERDVEKALTAAGMQLAANRKRGYLLVSSVQLKAETAHRTTISCASNCYVGSKASASYYFFRDQYGEADQPLFCYEGVSTGVMPVLIQSPKMLEEEMKECGLNRVDLPFLTVLLSHHREGEPMRTIAKTD